MRKILALFLSTVMVAILLVGCGESTATTQPAPQPAVEVETPKAEVSEPAPEPVVEPEVEEPSEEPVVEEPSEEPEVEAPSKEPEEPEEPEEVDPMEALMESNMGEYVSDGVFDIMKFSEDTGAEYWWIGDFCIAIIYGDWYIQSGNFETDSERSYLAIGKWDETNEDHYNLSTYSYVFPGGNDIIINGENIKITVPAECIIHLHSAFDSVKESGPEVVPDIPDTNFKPCDPDDCTIQY